LSSFVHSIRLASIGANSQSPAAFLVGDAGTGKTRFAIELGKALGLYVCHTSLAKQSEYESSRRILFGASFFGPAWTNTHKIQLGIIAKCALEAGHLNFIIFFDEVRGFWANLRQMQHNINVENIIANISIKILTFVCLMSRS
jgi:hypothetical protein